jgi:hypothetical protein
LPARGGQSGNRPPRLPPLQRFAADLRHRVQVEVFRRLGLVDIATSRRTEHGDDHQAEYRRRKKSN